MFFAMLTSRETFLQNYLPKHLYRELVWLQTSHCPSYSRGQAFGVKSKVGIRMKVQAFCFSLSCFQHAWVSQGLGTTEQGPVSRENASWVKKWGNFSEYLWTGKLKISKELCTLSLWRAAYTFSSIAKTASSMDKVGINHLSSSMTALGRINRLLSQRSWGAWWLCKCLPSAGNKPASEGTFHGLKSQKALLGLMLVINEARRKEMDD